MTHQISSLQRGNSSGILRGKAKHRRALCCVAHKGPNVVYLEMHEILIRIIVGRADFRLFLSEHFHYRGVGFLPDLGQMQSFAGISFALLDEHVSSVWIGFKVLVGQTLAHDKRDSGFVDIISSIAESKLRIPEFVCCCNSQLGINGRSLIKNRYTAYFRNSASKLSYV